MWGNPEVGPKVIGLLSYDHPEADASKIAEVSAYLQSVLNSPSIIVGVAEYKRYPPNEARLVFPILISGLTAEQATDLVEFSCFAAPAFTLHCYQWPPFVTNYALTLQGFSLSASEASALKVSELVRKTLLESPQVACFVRAHYDNLPEGLPEPSNLSLVVDSIYAVPITLAAAGGGSD